MIEARNPGQGSIPPIVMSPANRNEERVKCAEPFANCLGDFVAAQVRHSNIQNHHIWTELTDCFQHQGTGEYAHDVMAFIVKNGLEGDDGVLVIVRHDDAQ